MHSTCKAINSHPMVTQRLPAVNGLHTFLLLFGGRFEKQSRLHFTMNRISVCLLLALLCIVVAISATKTTPVDCDYIDAQDRKGYQHVFNLSVLQRQTSEHLLKVYDPKGPWTYEFSICNNFECGKWDTGVCQHGQNEDVPCSEEFSQRFNAAIYDHELQALTLLVPMTEGNGTIFRGSEITIVCDPHALYVDLKLHDLCFSI